MTYEIACTRGLMKGRRWNVTQQGLKIGRAEGCEIQVGDVAADLYHCVVKLVDGKPSVQNLASDNGVDVNGTNVDEAELGSNDTIRIGNERFILLASGGEKGGSGARVAVAACALCLVLAAAAFVIWRKGQAKSVVAPPAATNAVAQVEVPVTTNHVVRIVTEELVTTNRIVSVVDNVVVTNYVVEVRRNGELVSSSELPEKGDEYVAAPECSDGLALSEDGKTLVSVPKELTSVAIPNGVTTIGDRAFENHKALLHVSIPPSVTKIGRDAFKGCDNMTGVFITDLSAWCRLSFEMDSKCWGNAWDNPLCYARNLYLNGSLIRNMEIPKSVSNIGRHTFRGCTRLTRVLIPKNVTYVDAGAFADCGNLKEFAVAEDSNHYKSVEGLLLTKDGRTLVAVPGGLETVNIPNGVVTIGGYAFFGCRKLSKVAIPDGVTIIGHRAFQRCSGIESIEIPPSMIKIGHDAFLWCDNLKGVYITDIAAGCNLQTGEFGRPFRDGRTGNLYLNGSLVRELKIPNGVTKIRGGVFGGCSSIVRVTIPKSVEVVDWGAFANCQNLTWIEVAGGNQKYKSDDGLLMSKDGKTLVAVPGGLDNVKIPNGVEVIGSMSFNHCGRLSEIKIPYGVTRINYKAFNGCAGIVKVEIPNSVKSLREYGAFSGCRRLASITIPGSVECIGSDTFGGCGSLTNIVIHDGVKRILSGAFANTGIVRIEIPDSVEKIGPGAFQYCGALESVTLPKGPVAISDSAFAWCGRLDLKCLAKYFEERKEAMRIGAGFISMKVKWTPYEKLAARGSVTKDELKSCQEWLVQQSKDIWSGYAKDDSCVSFLPMSFLIDNIPEESAVIYASMMRVKAFEPVFFKYKVDDYAAVIVDDNVVVDFSQDDGAHKTEYQSKQPLVYQKDGWHRIVVIAANMRGVGEGRLGLKRGGNGDWRPLIATSDGKTFRVTREVARRVAADIERAKLKQ